MTQATRRRCIFCSADLSGKKAKEHVLRKSWLKRLGHMKSPVRLTVLGKDGPKAQRSLAAAALQAGDICSACNGGWMNALDKAVEDELFGLIEGSLSVTTLSDASRRRLGRWILKTSCAFKATDSPSRRHLPNEVLQGVQREGYLPSGFFAFVSRTYGGTSGPVQIGHLDAWVNPPAFFEQLPQTKRLKFAIQYNTLVIGCAYVDHPDILFRLPPDLVEVFVTNGCEVREDIAILEHISELIQPMPVASEAVNWVMLLTEAALHPAAVCRDVNTRWLEAIRTSDEFKRWRLQTRTDAEGVLTPRHRYHAIG